MDLFSYFSLLVKKIMKEAKICKLIINSNMQTLQTLQTLQTSNFKLQTSNFLYILSGTSIPRSPMPVLITLPMVSDSARRKFRRSAFSSFSME